MVLMCFITAELACLSCWGAGSKIAVPMKLLARLEQIKLPPEVEEAGILSAPEIFELSVSKYRESKPPVKGNGVGCPTLEYLGLSLDPSMFTWLSLADCSALRLLYFGSASPACPASNFVSNLQILHCNGNMEHIHSTKFDHLILSRDITFPSLP